MSDVPEDKCLTASHLTRTGKCNKEVLMYMLYGKYICVGWSADTVTQGILL